MVRHFAWRGRIEYRGVPPPLMVLLNVDPVRHGFVTPVVDEFYPVMRHPAYVHPFPPP